MKALNIRISGKVQGVWFRKHTKLRADGLNIKGFVRNERDGSVYVEAEGEPDAVAAFVEWCGSGPERAKVEDVRVEVREPRGFDRFSIEY